MLLLRCSFFTFGKQVKKFEKSHFITINWYGGGEGVVVQGRGGGGINGLLSHPSSYLNPSPLSKCPSPPLPPLWIYQYFFFSNNFLQREHLKWKATPMLWFFFHFKHLFISNLNGHQGQIGAYLPASFSPALMHMHHICYTEWRCLVLKDADSLWEKSFSPANDMGTKWEITPQAWEGLIYECYHIG